ncbi:MAG: hypothetical protein ACM3U0_01790 [archaeon]
MKYLIGTVVLAFALCSCAANKSSPKSSGETTLSHNITIGESGGFTGNNEGYTIDSTGMVKSFKGIMTQDPTEKLRGRLNEQQMQKINGLITELLKIKYSEKGNLTSYITLRSGNTVTNYSWPGPSLGKDVPEPVSRFYTELTNIINSL